jgi:hypothetical protein
LSPNNSSANQWHKKKNISVWSTIQALDSKWCSYTALNFLYFNDLCSKHLEHNLYIFQHFYVSTVCVHCTVQVYNCLREISFFRVILWYSIFECDNRKSSGPQAERSDCAGWAHKQRSSVLPLLYNWNVRWNICTWKYLLLKYGNRWNIVRWNISNQSNG